MYYNQILEVHFDLNEAFWLRAEIIWKKKYLNSFRKSELPSDIFQEITFYHGYYVTFTFNII